MRVLVVATVAVGLMLGGCATKRYGRLQPLSPLEAKAYDCDDIALELSKIEAFQNAVADGSRTNGASIAAFLVDFGLGNKMEKDAAEKTARERKISLQTLAAQRNCAA